MAPARFGDFSKKTNDLLSNDYNFDRKFKLTTKSQSGVTFTSEGALKPKKLDGKLSAKWSPAEGLFVDKLSVSTEGRLVGEATLKNPHGLKNFDLVCRVQDGAGAPPAGELEVKHSGAKMTMDCGVDVVNGPTIFTSASVLPGVAGLTLGGSLKLDTKLDAAGGSPDLKDYNLGLQYVNQDVIFALTTKDKLKTMSASVYVNSSPTFQVGAQVNMAKFDLKSVNLASMYQIDKDTKLQTKVDNKGIISANYILAIKPDVKGIASVQVDAMNFAGDSHKLGLSLVLG